MVNFEGIFQTAGPIIESHFFFNSEHVDPAVFVAGIRALSRLGIRRNINNPGVLIIAKGFKVIIDFELLNKLPGAIGFKDRYSTYLGGNQQLANVMGYRKPQDIVGMKDTDIKSDMVAFADKFISDDKAVMLSGERQHIDIGLYDGICRATLSTKKTLLNASDEVIGTVFSRTELKSSIMGKLFGRSLAIKSPQYYTIGGQFGDYNLSKRETDSLFYVIRGYTAKEIAQKLAVSPKTIEYYIEQLKNKLNCSKKSELIEKSVELGFIYNLPMSILEPMMQCN